MEFTGERMIPEHNQGQEIYLEHLTRYIFATQFVKNKVVLDIACGSGYGSQKILEAGAKKVIGIDIDEETIVYCKQHYLDRGIEFIQGSADKISLPNNSIDVVVSFETIEHVDEKMQIKFLEEIKRVLKKGGVLIVSTPNSSIYPKGNPFHLKELDSDEFRRIMSDNFQNVRMFYQDDAESSYIISEKNSGNVEKILESFEKIEAIPLEESTYLIAVCSDNNLENITGYVGLSNMKPWNSLMNEIIRIKSSIQERNKEIEKKDQEIGQKNELLQIKDQKIQENDRERNMEIEKKDQEIGQKNELLQRKDQEIDFIKSSKFWKLRGWDFKIKFVFFHPIMFTKKYLNKIKTLYLKVIFSHKKENKFKKYLNLGKMALNELKINGFDGMVFAIKRHLKKRKGMLATSYPRQNDYIKNLVSIVILSKNRIDLIENCINSIENNLSKKYDVEIIIGDTGTDIRRVLEFYEKAKNKFQNLKIVSIGKYYFSKNYNQLISDNVRGEYVIFLNNDTIVKDLWIDELITPLEDKKIGIVGGKLLYRDNTIQHAGIEFNSDFKSFHPYKGEPFDIFNANYPAFVSAVTFACVAMRHDVFDRFKLCEEFVEEAQDTDLCFRLLEAGFKILYNNNVEIYHIECSTRDWRKGESDRILFNNKWRDKISKIVKLNKQRIQYNPDEYKESIVVIRDDGIGDLLMGISAFNNLRKINYNRKLILATYERNAEMMSGFKIFDEIICIPDGKKYSPLPIPTKRTIIYNLINLEMNFAPVYGIPTEKNKFTRHEVFSKVLGIKNEYESIEMPEFPEAKKEVLKLLKERGVDEKLNFVVLNLIATNPARSWWYPYYPMLIEAIEKMGFTPLVVGMKNNEYFKGKKIINITEKTKTIAEYIEAIKLGKYVVSTDTSTYHIAALVGIPFLVIFTGGVRPESRLKYYSKYEAIEPSNLACHPCWDEGCKNSSVRWKKDPCRLIIKPEEVIEKFKNLIKKYPIK